MKNMYILYIVGAIALVGTMNALKHLIRSGEWQPIMFVAIKDVILVGIVVYLARLIRTSTEIRIKMLAARSIAFALLVSFVADAAITLIRV